MICLLNFHLNTLTLLNLSEMDDLDMSKQYFFSAFKKNKRNKKLNHLMKCLFDLLCYIYIFSQKHP